MLKTEFHQNLLHIQPILLEWFLANQRDLPWRKTYDPYQILVSEFMAQQTRMETVIDYFHRWIEVFPDIESLANASDEHALKLWEGLGYYRRCRNLLTASREIVENHNGKVPFKRNELESLPGIGPYTAGAIASIAYEQPEVLVDGNVKRVLARLGGWKENTENRISSDFFQKTAKTLLKQGYPREINQGLMEFGALICSPSPKCEICPISDLCIAFKNDLQNKLPIKKKASKITRLSKLYFIVQKDHQVWLGKQSDQEWWSGMWNFPSLEISNKIRNTDKKALGFCLENTEKSSLISLEPFQHSITRYLVKVYPYIILFQDIDPFQLELNKGQWFDIDQLENLSLPKPAVVIRDRLKIIM